MNEADRLLRKLLETGFCVTYDGNLCWRFIEDVTIAEVLGAEFESALHPYLKEQDQRELAALDTTERVG